MRAQSPGTSGSDLSAGPVEVGTPDGGDRRSGGHRRRSRRRQRRHEDGVDRRLGSRGVDIRHLVHAARGGRDVLAGQGGRDRRQDRLGQALRHLLRPSGAPDHPAVRSASPRSRATTGGPPTPGSRPTRSRSSSTYPSRTIRCSSSSTARSATTTPPSRPGRPTRVSTRCWPPTTRLYGRRIELVRYYATGNIQDSVAATADAETIARDIKPFVVIGGPLLTEAFADTLAANKVICVSCSPGQPAKFYVDRARTSGTSSRTPSQTQQEAAEYIGKRLGRPQGRVRRRRRQRQAPPVRLHLPVGDSSGGRAPRAVHRPAGARTTASRSPTSRRTRTRSVWPPRHARCSPR